MKNKIIWTVSFCMLLAFALPGCYTVLMRPGMNHPTTTQADSGPMGEQAAENLDQEYYQSNFNDFTLPYYWGNDPPPSAFIFYYSTAWWNDSYTSYIEAKQDNSLPEPRNFSRRGATSGTEASSGIISGSSASGGSSAVLTKKTNESSDTTNTDGNASQRQPDNRREITRRQSSESSDSASDSKVKRKK